MNGNYNMKVIFCKQCIISNLKPNIIPLRTFPEKNKDVILSLTTTLVVKLAQDPLREDITSLEKAKQTFSNAYRLDEDELFGDPIKNKNLRVFNINVFSSFYIRLATIIETSTQNRSVIIEDALMALQRILLEGVSTKQIVEHLFEELNKV